MMAATIPSVSDLPLTLLGRWSRTERGFASSWVSATVRFRCAARGVALLPGPSSKRYDAQRADAGIKMIVVYLRAGVDATTFETDVDPGVETKIYEGDEKRDVEVEIMLSDWSATLELQSFSIIDVRILVPGREPLLIRISSRARFSHHPCLRPHISSCSSATA
jgi:hypothetical protein